MSDSISLMTIDESRELWEKIALDLNKGREAISQLAQIKGILAVNYSEYEGQGRKPSIKIWDDYKDMPEDAYGCVIAVLEVLHKGYIEAQKEEK